MNQQNGPHCPRCQVPLSGQSVGDSCANCLLQLALELPQEVVPPHSLPSEPGEVGGMGAGGGIPDRARFFGDYELLEEIARGGMGVVYRARQLSLHRVVALKMVLGGNFSSAATVQRFRMEAGAAARLEHPNIVPIHEIGEHLGQHYFSMRLMEGGALSDTLREGRIAVRQAVELVATVTAAVHHAHQRGILHRDLKPANILFDGAGQPFVADFGLAKSLDHDNGLTRSASVLGTPAYMAPEQAAGASDELTTAVDVYGLGAVLYELVTGVAPFRGTSAADTLRQVLEADPVAPRRLNPDLDRDLESVCLKCLEKDPARRYGSAEALGEDLRRWLACEPVTAAGPSRGYRFRKFARRNRVVLGMSVLSVLVLVAATVLSLRMAIRAMHAESAARQRVVELASERDAKDEARLEAEAVSSFLTEIFESPVPSRDGHAVTVAETLQRAAQKAGTEFTNRPALRNRLQRTLGKTYHELGLHREAVPLLESVRTHTQATLGEDHPETIWSMRILAASLGYAGRRAESLELHERVLRQSRKVMGEASIETAMAKANLASSYENHDRLAEALQLREQVLAYCRGSLGDEHRLTLEAFQQLALSYQGMRRFAESLQMLESLLALRRRVLSERDPATLWTMLELGVSYSFNGRHEEAMRIRERTVELSRDINGPEHPDTLWALNNLGISYQAIGRHPEAIELFERLVPMYLRILGPTHDDTLWAMTKLGVSYAESRRFAESQGLLEKVLSSRREKFGPEHRQTLWAMDALAELFRQAGRPADAVSMREQILAIRRKISGVEALESLDAAGYLANSYQDAGRLDDAIQLQESSLEIMRRTLPSQHKLRMDALGRLARSYELAGRAADAERLLRERATLSGPAASPGNPR